MSCDFANILNRVSEVDQVAYKRIPEIMRRGIDPSYFKNGFHLTADVGCSERERVIMVIGFTIMCFSIRVLLKPAK